MHGRRTRERLLSGPGMASANRGHLAQVLRAAMLAALTAALAQIQIPLPFTPVPVTLQVMGVLLSGMLLPPRLAAVSQIIYVGMGAVGLPVFAGGAAGPHVLAGPTGGYLWGFVSAAYAESAVQGLLLRRKRRVPVPRGRLAGPGRDGAERLACFTAAACGVTVLYAAGVAQLAAVTGSSLGRAVQLGALPFIGLDALKALVAASIAPALRSRLTSPGSPGTVPQAGSPGA